MEDHHLELMSSFLIDGTTPCCSCGWRSENIYPSTDGAREEHAGHVARVEAMKAKDRPRESDRRDV